MNNLVRTEWLKIKKYPAFWWIIGVTVLSYPGINFIFYNIYREIISKPNAAGEVARMISNPFEFPEAWHTVAYASSVFVFIPAVVVIMFITNEYTFKTHRQNVIDGWSRNTFMTSKLIDVVIISLLITLLYIITSLIIGFINKGESKENMFGQAYYAALFLLQTFSQLSIAFLLGFLVRKAFIALGIFLFYFIILEPLAVGFLRAKFKVDAWFFPLEISDRLIPVPTFIGKIDKEAYNNSLSSINIHILYTIILTFLVWFFCYKINSRRDL
jgi:ABC-2 type transport system permease protein